MYISVSYFHSYEEVICNKQYNYFNKMRYLLLKLLNHKTKNIYISILLIIIIFKNIT